MTTQPNFDLSGKVALVTGASRGIGQVIAAALAAAGASVVLASRKQATLDAGAAEINAAGGTALAVAAHTGDSQAVQALVDRAVQTFGGVDIAVNNAATNPHFGHILTADDGQWDKILDVYVKGYLRVAKACAPVMKKRGGVKIINMASVAGKTPEPGMGVYCVRKAAVLMRTEGLAAALAADHMQAIAIAPRVPPHQLSQAIWGTPQILEALTKTIPQKRIAAPQELAGIALYLASDASSFTTGATFVIDGSQLVGSPVVM